MKNVLIIGATSAIALATARKLAEQHAQIYLMARDGARLGIISKDLEVRGASNVQMAHFDACDYDSHGQSIENAFAQCQTFDLVLICHGSLPDQELCQSNAPTMLTELGVNGISVLSLLTHIANHMGQQASGTIAVITSVAGDRGRQSNYVYGSSKKMVSTFLEGLRNRLYEKNVNVLDIRPGFVDTPMTSHLEKGALWAQPDTIATDILKAVEKKRSVIYTPGIWRLIMLVVRSIPEFIFVRLKL